MSSTTTMPVQANRGYFMSESCEIEENFEVLKEMFVNSKQSVQLLELQRSELENNIKALSDANASMKEYSDRLLAVNNKQRMLLDTLNQSFRNKTNSLKTELDKLKKENLELKSSRKSVPNAHAGTIENYNSLLQKRILDLEKELLQYQKLIKQNSSLHCPQHEKELSKLKIKNNELYSENKSLKKQLINFRALHHQIISEIQLKNPKYASDRGNQQARNTPGEPNSPITIDLIEDELQPVQVHVIDSDIECIE